MVHTQEQIKQAHILLVDDNSTNVALLEKLLANQGFRNVDSTTDPFNVMPILKTQEIDLLILDLSMPGMSGFDVMHAIRKAELPYWVPIIVLTAHDDKEARLRALSLGARDFILKPFNNMETLNRIRNTIELKLMHANLATQNKNLDAKVRERTKELEDAQIEILRALSRAAECKDNETGNHTIRMARYAQLIALEYGMPEIDALDLFYASPMHDVGKIGIGDNILLKPGKLTEDEFAIMKQHTTLGFNILTGHGGGTRSKLVCLAASIALNHHEKWNGQGYPNGTAGTNIPLPARIVAIADVFDALTVKRPYKPAWPNEEAIAYIKDQANKQFDPELVDAFIRALPSILLAQKEYRDLDDTPNIETIP